MVRYLRRMDKKHLQKGQLNMSQKKTLNSYKFTSIEDWGGVISEDFKQFSRLYKNKLNRMCKQNNWQLVNFNHGHYYCSWFIKNEEGKFVYCSFSDVRHFAREWYKCILHRVAKDEHDYHGGSNWYTELENLEGAIARRFQEGY